MKSQTLTLKNRIGELTKFTSDKKPRNKTSNLLKIFFYVCLFSIVTATASQARDVTLQWDPDTDTSVTGYKINYNADSATIPFSGTGAIQGASPIDVKNLTSSTVTGLDPSRSYYFAITAYNASGAVSSYSNIVSVAEAVPPTVSITSPATNTTISGTVSVTAGATDNVGVTKVEFYLNGVLKTTDTSIPYLYSLSTTSLAAGTYTLMAKAYDAVGNVGQSSNVSVSVVNDTTAPTASLTAPGNNATVSGTTTITASASDNVGVSKVEFYKNGVLLSATNVAPFSYNWNTTTDANGGYTLTAKAYDNTGNVGQSANVLVTVNNPVADTTAPTVAVTAPANSAIVSGTVSVTASASDNVGVSKVEFYVNSILAATDTVSPFAYSWNTALAANGTYSIMAKAYDSAGNVGQSVYVSTTVKNTITPPAGTLTAVFGNAAGSNYPNTVADTYLNLNTGVNAASTVLNTYTWPAGKPANSILMSWNLSSLPAGAQIQSATLSLYMTGSGGDALYEMPASGIINKLPVIAKSNGNTFDGTNAWTASSVPYGGIPLAQSDIATAIDAPLIDKIIGYKSWNVTSIVKDWIAIPVNNKGLLLNSSSKASADSSRVFASSEAVDANQRPKLVVTYTLASDSVAPSVAISTPSAGTTVSGTVTVNATASDNVGVGKVEFYVNSILQATDTASPYIFSWNTAALANGSYTLIAKAYDAAGNSGASSTVTISVSNPVATPATYTIWSASTVPVVKDGGADSPVELGVKIRSDVNGSITGIRFYKASTNTGTHIANLWTSTGTLLATATFAGETASGWQQVNFATPVAVSANTVYVASYHTNVGHYSADLNYFAGKGVDTAPLHALANGVSGANSVYSYGTTSLFPSQSYLTTNYWVDAVFKP